MIGRRQGTYAAVAIVFILVYVAVTWVTWANRTWDRSGPLSRTSLATPFVPPLVDETSVLNLCDLGREKRSERVIRGAVVDGRPLYACYVLESEGGPVYDAWVVDANGQDITDSTILKRVGAWRWIGLVKTAGDIVAGGLEVVGALAFWLVYYRRPRRGAPRNGPWWQNGRVLGVLAAIPVLGWIILARLPRVGADRKVRAFFQAAAGWAVFFFFASLGVPMDALSGFVISMVIGSFVFGIVGGRLLIAPPGFGSPSDVAGEPPARMPSRRKRLDGLSDAGQSLPSRTVVPPNPSPSAPFPIERPGALPTFADVGGMEDLKTELRETIGLALAFAGEADAYRLTWNGILLHGRPGVGKTFIARAVAGELGLNFIQVSAGDLVSAYRGESSRNVEDVFAFAARNVPCLLFLDEFDSIAQNREDWPDQEARRTVNQLLQTIVEYRVVREQIVVAATNHLEQLDPAVIRPGRFDRLIRVDLPDERARAAIFAACLRKRPTGTLDLAELGRRSAGMTPAAIAQVVEHSAMDALSRTARQGKLQPISQSDLVEALGNRGGEDRPSIEGWTWDDLVLPEDTLEELQQLQYLFEDAELAQSLGVEPPTGLLLTGPPGTGKTSVARVLAAQADCSFYPVTAADLTSMWLGESEKSIQRLFERARENRPSIVFLDEIDAIASKRGQFGSYDRQVNELLQQMDGLAGQQGVFVVAATNRADQLDPALLRGGRLSRTIEILLPDRRARRAMLDRFTRRMPLQGVDLDGVALATDGASGADIKALCQQAALHALSRLHERNGRGAKRVIASDFDEALTDRAESISAIRDHS